MLAEGPPLYVLDRLIPRAEVSVPMSRSTFVSSSVTPTYVPRSLKSCFSDRRTV